MVKSAFSRARPGSPRPSGGGRGFPGRPGGGRGRPGRSPRRRPGLGAVVGVVSLSLFLSGFCGIISELSLFNLAEALLGGTNANLTYTMGLMMFAMGVGSAFTAHRWFREVSVELFIAVECLLSLVTMGSVALIYLLAGWLPGTAAVWIWVVSPVVGLLVGMEIPIVLRINDVLGVRLRLNAPLVMAPDYFGALAAFALFTFLLLPGLGLGRTAWLGGVLNLAVAAAVALVLAPFLRRPLAVAAGFGVLLPLALWLGWGMPRLMAYAEQLHYRDGIVAARETPYQRIVVTDRVATGNPTYGGRPAPGREIATGGPFALREFPAGAGGLCPGDVRLFINGGLQFSSCDEHRYHEMLVHPAYHLAGAPARALVLGGGDGMAVRELLKHPLQAVTLVELDGEMIALFRDDPRFAALNGGALRESRVTVVTGDAFRYLRETADRFGLVIMDFPDPHRTATARLYSTQFFRAAARVVAPGGVLVTQSMSPLFQPLAFLSVRKTMEAAGWRVVSLQVPMLAFEHWGFQIGSREMAEAEMAARLDAFAPTVPTRFLNGPAVQAAHRWGRISPALREAAVVNDQFTLPLLPLYRRALRRP